MKKKLSPILALLLAIVAAFFGYTGLTDDAPAPSEPVSIVQDVTEEATDTLDDPTEDITEAPTEEVTEAPTESSLDPDGAYTTREDVALYLYTYGELPSNFITKKEAKALGWPGGGLDDYAYGKCIGGDRFGNYEEILPDADGRTWTECDIDTLHAKSRGAKRIVFSNDGLIYYTDDHYESFELLYGEP